MTIPPEVELRTYDCIGIINFECNVAGNMDECMTRRFVVTVETYQEGVVIIALGDKQEVLASLGLEQMSPEAIREIGRKYKVDAVFSGDIYVAEIWPLQPIDPQAPRWLRPKPASGKTDVRGKSVNALVNASLEVRLWDAQTGRREWRGLTQDEEMVREVKILQDGTARFDAEHDPEAFWDLASLLIKDVTVDFKIRHEKIR